MSYSVESILFKAAVGVVNTAARAANSLLEVMYPPRYDAAHIWDELDVPAGSVASGGPAPTDPPSGGVADPARGTPPPLAGSLTWEAWSIPAILEVLSEHMVHLEGDPETGPWRWVCAAVANPYGAYDEVHEWFTDLEGWREHVAPIIAERIGCDPTRAALALTSLQSQ